MINIITPCSRPENVDIIYQSIPSDSLWHLVFDRANRITADFIKTYHTKPNLIIHNANCDSYWGKAQINWWLDHVQVSNHDWVYVLDDDNLLVPRFSERIKQLTEEFPDTQGFIFQQYLRDGIREIDIRVGKIDQAQFILKRGLISTKRYSLSYDADGRFITELYKEFSPLIQCVLEPLSHYNRLTW